MHVTEDELRELAGSGEGRAAAVARLVERSPSAPDGELRTDQDGPARVDRSELDVLRRGGERPQVLVERLAAATASPRRGTSGGAPSSGPTRRPPRFAGNDDESGSAG
jgi:hypothetical protein